MVHAAIHPLTPGSPAYALLKVGAVGSIFAVRMAVVRRGRRSDEGTPDEPEAAPPRPHPVSKRKARRRKRR